MDPDEFLDWVISAVTSGHDLLAAIVHELERDASDLAIDPSAWDNTMVALEWAVTQGLRRESLAIRATAEDLQRIRRVRALASSVLAGEDRSPDLLPLARQCLEMLQNTLQGTYCPPK